jgi:hypothetical protein|tara:strand:- start:122 stop:691 length:570 start_codon:yes stop_codon:yes gene_type:complete
MAKSNTIEIIRGIAQAAANSYDGAHDKRYSFDGEERKVGLKREKGDPIIDSRIMDGFSVRFHGPMLCIHYHGEIKIKDVHDKNFESDIESMIADIAKFLRKEYKKVTGNSLTLSAQGEPFIDVQSTSRVRAWVQAYRNYKISGVSDIEEVGLPSEERLDDSIKKFLAIGKDSYPKASKPKNVTRKGEKA